MNVIRQRLRVNMLHYGHMLLFLFPVALAKLQETETETKSKQVEVKHELEGYEAKVKENQGKTRHWKKEVSG